MFMHSYVEKIFKYNFNVNIIKNKMECIFKTIFFMKSKIKNLKIAIKKFFN